MKKWMCFLITVAINSYAEVYKCGNSYSQESCGDNAVIIKFENQPKTKTVEHQISKTENIKVMTGKVIRVIDGDTITIQTNMGKEKIRLAQIDAPETSHFGSKSQPFGKEAKFYLQQRVKNQNVRVEVEAIDQYKRNVGAVFVDGNNINYEMVKNGFAWAYRQYLQDSTLLELEKSARTKRLGLWSLENPIYPPDFRKSNK